MLIAEGDRISFPKFIDLGIEEGGQYWEMSIHFLCWDPLDFV
jgi:hypothetical protein